jgi:hypothetical protein
VLDPIKKKKAMMQGTYHNVHTGANLFCVAQLDLMCHLSLQALHTAREVDAGFAQSLDRVSAIIQNYIFLVIDLRRAWL